MKSDNTIVLGVNKDGDVGFIKSFNYDTEKDSCQEAYNYVSKNFPNYVMGDSSMLKHIVDEYL